MVKESSVEERRRYVRLNSAVDIKYSTLEEEPAEKLKTKTRNISAGGICIIADEKLETDSVLVLSVFLSAGRM